MTSLRHCSTALAALLFALPAVAQVTVTDAYVRSTVKGQMATAAFMKLQSAKDARLVEAKSPVAGVVEIHEMVMQDNVMRMRAVDAVDLPAGRKVELKPGGYHVMLMDIKQRVKTGDVVPVTLVIDTGGKRETMEIRAPVRAATARGDATKEQ
jgi:copper(I)-binding protein